MCHTSHDSYEPSQTVEEISAPHQLCFHQAEICMIATEAELGIHSHARPKCNSAKANPYGVHSLFIVLLDNQADRW